MEHRHGDTTAKANGVTFEGGVPAEHEVYFAITDSTVYRAPTMTLTHRGGVEIEDVDRREIAEVPFDALTGLKAFVVANALWDIAAPKEIISPLVQYLPKLWELVHHYGMTTLELNPIRMRAGADGRLTPWPATSSAALIGTTSAGNGWTCRRTSSRPIPPTSSRKSTSADAPGSVGRLCHQRPGHDPRANLWRRRELPGHGSPG